MTLEEILDKWYDNVSPEALEAIDQLLEELLEEDEDV